MKDTEQDGAQKKESHRVRTKIRARVVYRHAPLYNRNLNTFKVTHLARGALDATEEETRMATLEEVKQRTSERLWARSIHETSEIVVKARFGIFWLFSAYLYRQPNGMFRSIGYFSVFGTVVNWIEEPTIERWVIATNNYLEQHKAITRTLIKRGMI
jgi:hypothetical protein